MKLTLEESLITEKVDKYFRSPSMSLRDKVFNAKLIALHDLELQHFAGPNEREKLMRYNSILEEILRKLDA